MRFSIVISLYNKERYIAGTLDSVKKQTFGDYEVIVVDDSSTDRSREIAKTYETDGRFHVYTVQNGGVSAARNYGIKKACGDYVCFLDADDLWKSEYLQEADRLLNKYGKRDFLCFAYDAFKGTKENVVWQRNLKQFFTDDDHLIDFYKYSVMSKCSVALTSAVVIRRKRLMELDYCFPVGISMGEDHDLWVRAAAKEEIIYSNVSLMLYRLNAVNALTGLAKDCISRSFRYWKWYPLTCYSRYKNTYTTRKVLSLASKCYKLGDSKEARNILLKAKGGDYLFKRIALYIISFL